MMIILFLLVYQKLKQFLSINYALNKKVFFFNINKQYFFHVYYYSNVYLKILKYWHIVLLCQFFFLRFAVKILKKKKINFLIFYIFLYIYFFNGQSFLKSYWPKYF